MQSLLSPLLPPTNPIYKVPNTLYERFVNSYVYKELLYNPDRSKGELVNEANSLWRLERINPCLEQKIKVWSALQPQVSQTGTQVYHSFIFLHTRTTVHTEAENRSK